MERQSRYIAHYFRPEVPLQEAGRDGEHIIAVPPDWEDMSPIEQFEFENRYGITFTAEELVPFRGEYFTRREMEELKETTRQLVALWGGLTPSQSLPQEMDWVARFDGLMQKLTEFYQPSISQENDTCTYTHSSSQQQF